MTENHPITPSPELVQAFLRSNPFTPAEMTYEQFIATRFARWGADQELEACCEWLEDADLDDSQKVSWVNLRAARRPKPPSLKEQALEALEQIDGWAVANMNHLSIHDDLVTGVEAIRRALEMLPE